MSAQAGHEDSQIDELVGQLKLLHSSLAHESPAKRAQRIAGEFRSIVDALPAPRRKQFVKKVMDRFPTNDECAAPAAPANIEGGGIAPDFDSVLNWLSDHLSEQSESDRLSSVAKLLQACLSSGDSVQLVDWLAYAYSRELDEKQRADLVSRLGAAGIRLETTPGDAFSGDLVDNLRGMLKLRDSDAVEFRAAKLSENLLQFAELLIVMDELIWQGWAGLQVRDRNRITKAGDVRRAIVMSLAGDSKRLDKVLMQNKVMLSGFVKALTTAGLKYANRLIGDLSPEAIQDSSSAGWTGKEKTWWESFVERFEIDYNSPAMVDAQLKDCFTEFIADFHNQQKY